MHKNGQLETCTLSYMILHSYTHLAHTLALGGGMGAWLTWHELACASIQNMSHELTCYEKVVTTSVQ